MRGETTIRQATICRETKETQIALYLNLEGGERKIETGIGFFDHMLGSFAVHGGFGLILKCTGDLEVDGHHTVEDVGIALGQAVARILGDRAGIARFGSSYVPDGRGAGLLCTGYLGQTVSGLRCTYAAAYVRTV